MIKYRIIRFAGTDVPLGLAVQEPRRRYFAVRRSMIDFGKPLEELNHTDLVGLSDRRLEIDEKVGAVSEETFETLTYWDLMHFPEGKVEPVPLAAVEAIA
jgi:hypothetical protein